MADTEEPDTGQNKTENPSNEEVKEKKDETNLKIKTEIQEKDSKDENDGKNDQTVEKNNPDATKPVQSQNTEQPNNAVSETRTKDNKQSKKKNSKREKKQEVKIEEVPVEVKIVQNHYKTHSKSTLPHILTEYGLEDKEYASKKQKEKKKKKIFIEPTDDSDSGQTRKKTGSDFQNLFGVRPTDSYYIEYIDFLEEKVKQQRLKAQKEKEEAAKRRLLELEAEHAGVIIVEKKAPEVSEEVPPEEEKKHHFTRRLERVELKHDDSFLRNLPKTDIARIIALQDKMKKEGKLKNQYDVDKFWDDIRDPKNFYEQFKVTKKDPSYDHLNKNSNMTGQMEDYDLGPRGLSHISEVSKASEPWAITQKFQSQNSAGSKSASSDRRRKDSTQVSKDAASELEKRCPKLEMPPLACFSLKLGEKPPDPDSITKKLELKAKEKTRKKFQRKLNKMYQMAMTNTAAANRILERHGDLTEILEGAALRDVLAVFDEPYPTLEEYYMYDPDRIDHPDDRASHITQSHSGSHPSTRHSSAASRKLTPISDTSSKTGSLARRKKKSPEMLKYKAPLPLSYDEVYTREKTLEPKCLSTMWTNYLQAGKSAFAS
ncbi:hypothetical protein ACF0H5_008316 [Mactra antiquata]